MSEKNYFTIVIAEAERLGVIEQVGELAREGRKAREISRRLSYALTPDQVRVVRDSLGIVHPPGTQMSKESPI